MLCAYYTYKKILNIPTNNINTNSHSFLFITVISFLVSVIFEHSVLFKIALIFGVSLIYLLCIYRYNIYLTINILVISFSLSFITYIFSSAMVSICFLGIYKSSDCIPYVFTYLPTGLVQFILMFFVINIKRFRSGILFITNKKASVITLFISIALIVYITYASTNKTNSFTLKSLVCILLFVFSFLLLYYWRYRIKQTYIENMRRLETISYENAIMDRDKQIKELKQGNAELGQIIHKYRKVIPAMELSVTELLQSSSTLAPEELNNRALALRTQLEELRSERNNLLDKYQKDTIVMAQSGLHTVDAMIALMEKRAKQEGIRYRTQIDPTLKELALNSVKESDLLHLLGDMIENAIHAVSLTEDKEILIHLGKLNDCLLLEVSDSGISFDIQTYQHFGNEPFTSHQSDGGSGTGLMDLWKLKKEYKASLYIYEYSSEHKVYTKKISLLFDRKNHFLLKTYRDRKIKNSLIRGDLHVFPHQTD